MHARVAHEALVQAQRQNEAAPQGRGRRGHRARGRVNQINPTRLAGYILKSKSITDEAKRSFCRDMANKTCEKWLEEHPVAAPAETSAAARALDAAEA